MSSEVRDPQFKLFGQTIQLVAADTSGRGGGGADNNNSVPAENGRRADKRPANGNDEQEQELSKGLSAGPKQTESLSEGSRMEKPSDIEEGSLFNATNSEELQRKPEMVLPCPRCNSMETKFCYFNNYNVNQPRYFCRNCQRYWTAGGAMRNVPIGAGRRRYKHGPPQYSRIMLPESLTRGQRGLPNGSGQAGIHHQALSPSGSGSAGIHHPALSPSGNGSAGIQYQALSPSGSGPTGIQYRAPSPSVNCPAGIQYPAPSLSGNGPAGIHHPALSPRGNGLAFRSLTPFCDTRVSGLSMANNNVRHHQAEEVESSGNKEDEDNHLRKSSVEQPRVGLEMMPNHHSFPPQMPGFVQAPWPYPYYPALAPPSFPAQFYPAGPPMYWNYTVPGSWNTHVIVPPMLPAPSSGTNSPTPNTHVIIPPMLPAPSPDTNSPTPNTHVIVPPMLPAPRPGTNLPTLGKHSRDENILKFGSSSNQGEAKNKSDPEKCLWVPKTIRIDDPDEAAKSSIWATLDKNKKADDSGVGGSGLCSAFQSKSKSDGKAQVPETSTVLQANPAALSRSLNFHESS